MCTSHEYWQWNLTYWNLPNLPNGTTLKEKEASRKDNQIALVHEKELPKNTWNSKNNNNNNSNYPANKKLFDNSISVIVLGDIMIKHLNGMEMSKEVNNPNHKIYVKHFMGAKTTCMKY